MKSEIYWISINEGLPLIPDNKYGISVLVATFDETYAEINNGDGWSVTSVLYGSILDRYNKVPPLFKGSNKLYDFMELYIGNNGSEYGPLADTIKYWAYMPDIRNIIEKANDSNK